MKRQRTLTGDILEPNNDDSVCSRCQSMQGLETHHISYIPEKTTTVCRDCHKYIHSSNDTPFSPKQEAQELFDNSKAHGNVPEKAVPTVKEINGNAYFYWNWRDAGKIKSKFICKLSDAPKQNAYTGPKMSP